MIEENAVKLSGIQPGDTVLELGYGPGLGLEAAAKVLTAPTGKVIGVDYSEYMHQVKCKYSHSVKANAVFHVYLPHVDFLQKRQMFFEVRSSPRPFVLLSFLQLASQRLKDILANGKLTLHLCDVAAMPLEDNTVDKAFHCNCYYYWPDLAKAATEIHRVMKPGRL